MPPLGQFASATRLWPREVTPEQLEAPPAASATIVFRILRPLLPAAPARFAPVFAASFPVTVSSSSEAAEAPSAVMLVSTPPPVSCVAAPAPLAVSVLFATVLLKIHVCAPALDQTPPPSAI